MFVHVVLVSIALSASNIWAFQLDAFPNPSTLRQPGPDADLPPDFAFYGDRLHISNRTWFAALFPNYLCQANLERKPRYDITGRLKIERRGDRALSLSWNGRPSPQFSNVPASFRPVTAAGESQPHYVVHADQWVTLHLQMNRYRGHEHLKIFVVLGKPGQEKYQLVALADYHENHPALD